MYVETTCNKCGEKFHIDLGDMSKEEAQTNFRKLDDSPRQCPGHHVEFGGWYQLWNLEDALHRAYDLGETVELDVQSDEDFVRELLSDGRTILDGGCKKLEHLKLPSIHDQQNLNHIGFGNFTNDTHVFTRCDSPIGTRFYERVEKQQVTIGT
jgi:hypothetical protein